jgi:hypothetical protein
MDINDVLTSVTEGIESRFEIIGFDAYDSLKVAETRPDGSALLEDVMGNIFVLRVERA